MNASTKQGDDVHAAQVYDLPPVTDTADGSPRRVGLELEFAGLSVAQTTDLLSQALGPAAKIEPDASATQATVHSPWGPFRVEVDATQLQDQAYLRPLEELGIELSEAFSKRIEDTVLTVAREVVPSEIVTPPIPWRELCTLDGAWRALREAGAKGTRTSALHAFGLHINPEIESSRVETTLAVLQSYLLLEDWLMDAMRVDLSRQVAPFIRGFPEAYRRLALAPNYAPDWSRFVADYLKHNPTRNRRLDLWPLIAHIGCVDPGREVRDWHLVKPRPTYHYRLPNCEITRPGWTPADACSGWVVVERLAHDHDLRRTLAERYLETSDWPLRMQAGSWRESVRHILSPLLRGTRLA